MKNKNKNKNNITITIPNWIPKRIDNLILNSYILYNDYKVDKIIKELYLNNSNVWNFWFSIIRK